MGEEEEWRGEEEGGAPVAALVGALWFWGCGGEERRAIFVPQSGAEG